MTTKENKTPVRGFDEPYLPGERAQLLKVKIKAALLAVVVERILNEDSTIGKRWPELGRFMDGLLTEMADDGE